MRRGIEIIMLVIFGGFLLQAALEDHGTKTVRRYLWWGAGTAAFALLVLLGPPGLPVLESLTIYAGLQFFFFSRMYGRADCHAFFCCGILLHAYGGNLKTCLWHMLVTFFFLGVVQLFKKNVNGRGNLKVPVALVPYLSLSLFPCLAMLLGAGLGLPVTLIR